MSYSVYYHPDVKHKDLPGIPENIKTRIRNAIESRLIVDPEKYGSPLRRGLYGYRKLRVGDYRIIYKLYSSELKVVILKIGHRREVYERVNLRLG